MKIKNILKIKYIITAIFGMVFFITCSNTAATGFEAGRIIDDVVMANKLSMDVSQIQAFLNSKVPVCDNWGTMGSTSTSRRDIFINHGWPLPLTCLKDYTENGKSSSQIIYDAAQEFSINPQVLIVLLQKEQGIVTDNWPDPTQYRAATGYGCPDTAACDSDYYGFTNQVRNAARMFRRIMDNSPTWYTPYVLGSNYIQYAPDPNCGGSWVNIQNRATQGLYNYTPYQPNQASLDAGYGSGNYCSSYGNRNFYLYFNDWFGSTTGKEGLIVKSSSSSGIFYIENGTKRAFPNVETFLSYLLTWDSVTTISDEALYAIPSGPAMTLFNVHNRDGQLIKTSAPLSGTYLVENGTKRAFPNAEIFLSYSYKWTDVITLSNTEYNLIPIGSDIPVLNINNRNGQLIKSGSPMAGIYLVENGTKRAFPNVEIFLSYSYKWTDVITLSNTEYNLIPIGSDITYNVNNRNGQLIKSGSPMAGIYLVENGTKRAFPNAEIFLSYSYKWTDVITLSNTEYNLIPIGSDITYNVNNRNGQLIKSGSPMAGIYLVENGTKRAFPNAEIFLSYSYKWTDVITLSNTEYNLIPIGSDISRR